MCSSTSVQSPLVFNREESSGTPWRATRENQSVSPRDAASLRVESRVHGKSTWTPANEVDPTLAHWQGDDAREAPSDGTGGDSEERKVSGAWRRKPVAPEDHALLV
jgi:hypothetical protein